MCLSPAKAALTLRQFATFASGLVDGDDEGRKPGEIHQKVVGQIAHALIVMTSENRTEHHAVGTAEGVVRHKGETTTVCVGGEIFKSLDFDLQSQLANTVF